MAVSNTKRIILLGKTGVGKSSLANTIFGEELFLVDHSFNSGQSKCQAETRFLNERSITLIDTPGFFDTDRSEKQMKSQIVRCIIESVPGPHALVIVLKVERFTKQEQAVIDQTCQHFSADALKYAIVVFTRGDQLPEGMKIEEYVNDSEGLCDLVEKCGGRCHVVDNKYWKKNQQDEYRSNQVQVAELLKTVDKIAEENNREYFSNAMLQEMQRAIQKEEERIKKSSGHKSQEEIRKQAKSNVFKKQVDIGLRKWGFAAIVRSIAALWAKFIGSRSTKVSSEAALEKDKIVPVAAEPFATAPWAATDASEPGAEEPVAAEPVVAEPGAAEPVAAEPVAAEPVAEPGAAEPVAAEPVAAEPVAEEPVAAEPGAAEPVAAKPVAAEPVAAVPVAAVPVAAEPVAAAPVAAEPVAAEPVAAASAAAAPVASASGAAAPVAAAPVASASGAAAPVAAAQVAAAPEAVEPKKEAETISPIKEADEESVRSSEVALNTSEAIMNDLFEKAYDIWNLFV